ncbi:MAG: hypothetical protein ACOVO2_24500 [Emticicia sp.]|uniref:hypothetical protein n=1 Tax=Emticicia sp. TaxID=1930953 RepID=UPI003BA4BE36
MKSLDNFSSFEITNAEEVQGGTFGLFSLLSAPKTITCQPAPKPAPCYTPPPTSCNTGGYAPVCAPKPTTSIPKFSFSFNWSFGGCR